VVLNLAQAGFAGAVVLQAFVHAALVK